MKKWLLAILLGLCLDTAGAAGKAPKPYVPEGIPQMGARQVDQYLEYAVELSRYKKPWLKRPIVLVVPNDQFIPLACGPRGVIFNYCPILGFFLSSQPHLIYLRDHPRLRDGTQKEVLVHEMVHWLQYWNGWRPKRNENCFEDAMIEVEAYEVSHLFAVLHQGKKKNFKLPSMNCPEDVK